MTSHTTNDLNTSVADINGALHDAGNESGDSSPATPRPVRVARPDAEKLPIEIARLLSDSRCTDVLVLDVRGLIDVQDFIVIASGTSERQIRAVSHQVKDLVESHGQGVYRTSADSDARWIVIDCVDVVVHLLEPNERSFRDFESMWGDAPRLSWARTGENTRQTAAIATPMMDDATTRRVETGFAPVESVAPASTKRAKGAKAAKLAAEPVAEIATPKPAAKGKPAKTAKKAKPVRGMSKTKAKAKAAAKADGTTAKRRAAAKLVKRAATKAAAKEPKKIAKRVAKKAGHRKDKPVSKPVKKAAAASARGTTKKSGSKATKTKPGRR